MATNLNTSFKLSLCSGAAFIENKEQLKELAAAVQMETWSRTDYHLQKEENEN